MAEKKQTKTGCFIATGRRKKSIARVRLCAGNGKIEVNGKDIDTYLQRDTLILIAKQPLTLTSTADKFDVVVNVEGGGIAGQYFVAPQGYRRICLPAGVQHRLCGEISGMQAERL